MKLSSFFHAKANRLALLDFIRGLNLISMILYHAMWDLVYMFGVNISWYRGFPGFLWQQSICFIFILLSGFCFHLGKRHLKSGIITFLAGALISVVTIIAMPEELILFGVLTLLGSSMLIMIPLQFLLKRIPSILGLAIFIFLFIITYNINSGYIGIKGIFTLNLPQEIYANYFTAFLGFPFYRFFSSDYFPLLPWFFLFVVGFYIARILRFFPLNFLKIHLFTPIEFMGRHSLIIYLAHQPIIYGALTLFFYDF